MRRLLRLLLVGLFVAAGLPAIATATPAHAQAMPDWNCDNSTPQLTLITCADEAAFVGVSVAVFAGSYLPLLTAMGTAAFVDFVTGGMDYEQCLAELPAPLEHRCAGLPGDSDPGKGWINPKPPEVPGEVLEGWCYMWPASPACVALSDPDADPTDFLAEGMTASYTGSVGGYGGHAGTSGSNYAFAFYGNVTSDLLPTTDWYTLIETTWASGVGWARVRVRRTGDPPSGLEFEYNTYQGHLVTRSEDISGWGAPFMYFVGRETGNLASGVVTDMGDAILFNNGNGSHGYRLFSTDSGHTRTTSSQMVGVLMQVFTPGNFSQSGMETKLDAWSDVFTFTPPAPPESPFPVPEAPPAVPVPWPDAPGAPEAPEVDPVPEPDQYEEVSEGTGDEGLFDRLANRIGSAINTVTNAIGSVAGWVVGQLGALLEWLLEQIRELFQWLGDLLEGLLLWLGDLLKWLGELLQDVIDALEQLTSLLGWWFQGLIDAIFNAIGSLGDLLNASLQGLADLLSMLWDVLAEVPEFLGDILSGLLELPAMIWEYLTGGLPSLDMPDMPSCEGIFPCSWVAEGSSAIDEFGGLLNGAGACTPPALGWSEFSVSFPAPSGCTSGNPGMDSGVESQAGNLFGFRVPLRMFAAFGLWLAFFRLILASTPWGKVEDVPLNPVNAAQGYRSLS